MSNVWKGVIHGSTTLRKGARRNIGNGCRTLFWDHCWALSQLLRELATQTIPIEIEDYTVAEMWAGNNWKWEVLSHLLPEETLLQLSNIQVIQDANAHDKWCWSGTSSGNFSVKSAHDSNMIWKKVWKIKAPQRVRNFLWLTLHDSFLCNEVKVRRHIATNPACPTCGDSQESCIHVLRDCSKAKELWHQLHPPATFEEFYACDRTNWISRNISCEGEWPTVFAITCWWLWRWRNNRAFSDEDAIPVNRGNFIRNQAQHFTTALTRFNIWGGSCKRKREITHVRWESPPLGWMKLNTDDASKGNPGLAGDGGVIRNYMSGFVKGFTLKCGICTSVRAELMAVLKGLLMVRDLGISKLILEVDSEVVVNSLLAEPRECNPNLYIIIQCRALIKKDDWEVRIKHVYREANQAADWLANESFSISTSSLFVENPSVGLSSILFADAVGCCRPRSIPE